MREGWEYKDLNDCCFIEYGTRVVQKKDGGTIYPVYGGGGETFHIDRYNREDCIIIARFAMSKTCVRYVSGRFFLNDSGLSVKASDSLTQEYLNHFLLGQNDRIYNLGKGAAQKNLDVNSFKKILVAIPPRKIQHLIVSELDKINELIKLKRDQLSELDKLQQVIFYHMFGDPTLNDKGWYEQPLSENVEEMFLGPFGSALKVSSYVEIADAYAMVYEQKHAIHGTLELDNHYISKEKYESLSRFEVRPGDFIMSCRGTIGKIFQLPAEAPKGIIHPSLMKIRIKEECYNPTFFAFLLRAVIQNERTKGNCVQMAITAKELGKKRMMIPPMSMQGFFAKRINSIEEEKRYVEFIIKDLEQLLASRMQYWFE